MLSMIEEEKLKRLLRTVGKTNFIEYFSEYKTLAFSNNRVSQSDKMPLAKRLLENNPRATKLSGQFFRIGAAISIFKNGWEGEALKEVINSTHPIITGEIKNKALVFLNKK